jgi:hypothetical protein
MCMSHAPTCLPLLWISSDELQYLPRVDEVQLPRSALNLCMTLLPLCCCPGPDEHDL